MKLICLGIALVLGLLVFSSSVFAVEAGSEVVASQAFSLESLTHAFGNAITGPLSGLGQDIVGGFAGWLNELVVGAIAPLIDGSVVLLTLNPDPFLLEDLWLLGLFVVGSLAVIPLMLAGFKVMVSGDSPVGRDEAKEWLRNSLLLVVFAYLSLWLYSLLLDLASFISLLFWSEGASALFSSGGLAGNNLLVLLVFFVAVVFLFLTMFARYILLLLVVPLLPIAVMLYFVPPVRKYGLVVFNLVGAGLLIQLLDVVFLSVTARALDSMPVPGFLLLLAAFAFLPLINLAILGSAVLKAFEDVSGLPVRQAVMHVVGGVGGKAVSGMVR